MVQLVQATEIREQPVRNRSALAQLDHSVSELVVDGQRIIKLFPLSSLCDKLAHGLK